MTRDEQDLAAQLLEENLKILEPLSSEMTEAFFTSLLAENESLRPLFVNVDMPSLQRRFWTIVAFSVSAVRAPRALLPVLRDLGSRHVEWGARSEDYPKVKKVLVETLRRYSGESWTPQVADRWDLAIRTMVGAMQEGAVLGESYIPYGVNYLMLGGPVGSQGKG